jgi:N-acetylglucosamine-6-phosphate deacetylase
LEVLPSAKNVVAGTPGLAGSRHFTDTCVANAIRFADVSLAEAVEMATIRPRQLLGLPIQMIEVGHPADLVVFDWQPDGEMSVKLTL